ncbi:transposase [Rhodobacteraceae bacterium N5(2021)]|uniref:Transposase n=1 Tax=Gymnodinialimonas phycosphaerae TaxID=2841589 RepID=A0A975YHG8_9RHOB|nr:transposase [Gymnodinialimonas phycosphaerae]MBY4892655.1 transposase [Gymnodinialimonas phycosphaerae]
MKVIGNAVLRERQESRIDWHDIAPRKPMQFAVIEAFIGRL